MTIIVFLVDTSASMNQRTYLGMTLMDVTKGAVETFMKIRARDPASRMDRYMLLTYEDPPANVKAGWKESHATFSSELKNLEANGVTTLGPALKHTFDLLNVNRMQSGIDTYGQGRCPFYLEPAVIVCISDGRKLTTLSTVQAELNLPMMNAVPGSELTKEPFRWDQRLFGIVLKMPAVPPQEIPGTFIPAAEDSPIDCMCDVMGGRSYAVSSQRMLHQCLESIVQKVHSGVVINFEKIGPDPTASEADSLDNKPSSGKENQDSNRLDLVFDKEDGKQRSSTPTLTSLAGSYAWHNLRKMIYVPRSAQKGYSVGHWPIPESFWPDLNCPMLQPRTAHPVVKFTCTDCDPLVVENFPFDKYELEPSPLTQYILERRQPNHAWQVFIGGSAKYSDIGHPFGYIKASSNLSTVNLFIMPYNYPVLLPLLDDLFKVHKLKPTQKWRQQFDNYLKTMPIYYGQPLRRALARLGVPNLVPDQLDNCLSYSVVSYLKKLKNQAKVEYERLVNSVGQKLVQSESIKVIPRTETSLLQRKDFKELMTHYGTNMAMLKKELVEFPTFELAVLDRGVRPMPYKNAYDIQRHQLIDQVSRMRANFFQSTNSTGTRLQDQDKLHSVGIGIMGNYQDYLKRMPAPLRELEHTPVRQHMFGNPFKVNKNLMLIDEADEAMPGQEKARRRHASSKDSLQPPSPASRKRKAGPLSRDIPYRKLLSPIPSEVESTPPSSPLPSPPQPPNKKLKVEADITLVDDVFETPQTQDTQINNEINEECLDSELLIDLCENNHIDTMHLDKNEDDQMQTSDTSDHITRENHFSHILNNNKRSKVRLKGEIHHNQRILKVLIKEVKRPGKNYGILLEKIEELQGSTEVQAHVLNEVISEATRFKRRALITIMQQFIKNLKKNDASKTPKVTNNHVGDEKSPNR